MNERIQVANADEFEPGDRQIVDVDGRSIGVFNIDGEYYAIVNQCAHDCGPVCKGRVKNQLVGTYNEPEERIEESFTGPPTVTCPLHGWAYDLSTGKHIGDPNIVLPTYDVFVENGEIYIEY